MDIYLTNNQKKLSCIAAIGVATASLLAVSILPVFAERPPVCLEAEPLSIEGKKQIRVRNKCGRNMNFKIIYARRVDSSCQLIKKAKTQDYILKGTFDGLGTC